MDLSVPLVLEYEDVAKRMTRETRLLAAHVDDIIDYLCSIARLREIHFLWRPVLKDSRDDLVLELAVEAECDVIITHNARDLTCSLRFGITAVTPGQFLRSIGGSS